MRIIVKGKNLDITDALRDYVLKKVQRTDRYFNNIQDAVVTLQVERGRNTAEVTMQISGAIVRAEERGDDMYAAIDRMSEKLERQVKRHKEKLSRKGRALEDIPPYSPPQPEAQENRIVRTKRFALKPMSPEEAIDQMELLGHDFFVYLNSATNQVNVVYKRRDGQFGLIEPETR